MAFMFSNTQSRRLDGLPGGEQRVQRLPAKVTEANFSWINVSPLSEKKNELSALALLP